MMNKKHAFRIVIAILSFYAIIEVAKAVENVEGHPQEVEYATIYSGDYIAFS